MLTREQQRMLVQLARTAVTAAVTRGEGIAPPIDADPMLLQEFGAFVTLHKHGELRGCIGFPEPVYPLGEAIIRGAIAAARHDPRFMPVSAHELHELEIEISILSPLQAARPDDVVVGIHGLVVEHGAARGLLLPQVPVEWGWDREQFLAHTCRKAGLSALAWQQGAALYTFTAEVFSEYNCLPAVVDDAPAG